MLFFSPDQKVIASKTFGSGGSHSFSLHTQKLTSNQQKEPFRRVLKKRCSEYMPQICRKALMPKCDLNKVAKQSNFFEIALRHGCHPVILLHIFRTPFLKNTSGRLPLDNTLMSIA